MKNLNSEETLWVILPIILVVGILIVSIIVLPKTQATITSKASTPTAVPTKVVVPTAPPSVTEHPEVICSSLYSPVCSQAGVTYSSECEANNAGITSFTKGECKATKAVTPTPKALPTSN